jgi:phosphomannomutase/phosphoglucomutase
MRAGGSAIPASDKAPELNLLGVQALGMGLGTLIRRLGAGPKIVVGHDFRSYSLSIKLALAQGLMAAGADVKDIGLALSPMAYFAQFALDAPSVAMVTASHNENGWTGVKMGMRTSADLRPGRDGQLRDIVLGGDFDLAGGGPTRPCRISAKRYIDDLSTASEMTASSRSLPPAATARRAPLRPQVLEARSAAKSSRSMSSSTTPSRATIPNPEDMEMLHAIRDKVLETGADVGLGFDGDGDRCGVVDNEGNEIFADKVGVMLARDISSLHANAKFVVDVKSTGLFMTDPVLQANGAT